MATTDSTRAVSVRVRFEVFKRDCFTCRYCGRKSPEVVLEVDHIVPICDGGASDEINLVTSCWECNRGKSGVPLNEVMTGEDPHDRAVLLLERERQLREYNRVLEEIRLHREFQAEESLSYWCDERGQDQFWKAYRRWLISELNRTPSEIIRNAITIAINKGRTKDMRYVAGILRGWRDDAE